MHSNVQLIQMLFKDLFFMRMIFRCSIIWFNYIRCLVSMKCSWIQTVTVTIQITKRNFFHEQNKVDVEVKHHR